MQKISQIPISFISVFIFHYFTISFVQCQNISPSNLENIYERRAEDGCLELLQLPNLRQVMLIRHGEPDLHKEGWRNRKAAKEFITDYDRVGIVPVEKFPICVDSLPDNQLVFHSTVRRAAHTAELIFADRFRLIGDPGFREFERKIFPFLNVYLPTKWWTTLSRAFWMLGANTKDIETFSEAKERARYNAHFLGGVADEKGLAILVAHGLHNRYVAKYLKKDGWKPIFEEGNNYFSVRILAK